MQTGSGSIIEDAYSGGDFRIIVSNASPKITQNLDFGSVTVNGGSPVISSNRLSNPITVNDGSPIITNNTLVGSGQYAIGLFSSSRAVVSDNHVSGQTFSQGGIAVGGGTPVIERNLIDAANIGIAIYGNSQPIIENNTIASDTIGVNIYNSNGAYAGSPTPTMAYNNFEQNSQYNIYLGQQGSYGSTAPNVNAADNWWGTTDLSIINQTIYDHKDNFNMGTVTFTPILTAPNAQAAPDPNAPIPTPNPQTANQPSQPTATNPPTSASNQNKNETSTFSQTDLLAIIAVLLAVIVGLNVAVIVFWRRSKQPKAKAGTETT